MTRPTTKLKLGLAITGGALLGTVLAFALATTSPAADPAVPDPALVGHKIPAVSAGRIVTWADMDGGAAGPMTVWVWLPPGYDAPGNKAQRFPVLYMHDGQNLFDPALSNYGKAWSVDRAITRMAARGDLRQWIVVGIQSPRRRYRTLFPAKLLPYLSAEMRTAVDNTIFDGGGGAIPFASAAYVGFLAGPLKAKVDRQFRTLPGRDDTAVMGSSMGGLMALYAMAERPDLFGQAAAVSIHLPLASPDKLPADAVEQVTSAWRRYLATSKMRPGANRLYMDHGTHTLDETYPPYFAAFDPMMAKAGWTSADYESHAFPSAEHDELAWAARIDIPLAFLDRKDP